jgi:hypothetical protein
VFAGQFAGYWRDGKRIVMDRNAVLPDRCIKCDEPANGYRRAAQLSYVPTGTELMFGAIAYISAKRASIEFGLCERHRRSRAINIALVSTAVLLASIYVFTQVRTTELVLPLLATVGLIGSVIGLVYAAVGTRVVRATKLTDTHIWLKGAGEAFLASLPPAPATAADGALPTLEISSPIAIEPAAAADAVYRDARRGALAFLLGCLITAGTYAALPGRYVIAWGAVAFGLFQLVRGLRAYRRVPSGHRKLDHALILVAIIGLGVIAGGWVATSEVASVIEANQFAAAQEAAANSESQANALFVEIANRQTWTVREELDMRKVASLYRDAADALASSPAPTAYLWYRDGLVYVYRQAAEITLGYSYLSASSSQDAFDALNARWDALDKDFAELEAKLTAQNKRSR